MADITSQTFKVDSCDIHYLTAGDPGNRTVILLHGMKFQAATWHELGTLQLLADAGFHAVGIDMPGFGKSPACSIDQDTVIRSLIDLLACKQVFLVGPSMGGRIALEFTIRYQDLINGLVLVGSVGVEENRDSLPTIHVPTLVVWGSEDQISPLVNCSLLTESIPGAEKIIIEGAPHPCYLDNPEKWHTELVRFLTPLTG